MSSSLETNKIAAAVLVAGVVAMTSGFIAQEIYHTEHPEQHAYIWAGVSDDQAAEATAEDTGPEPVLPLLAAADAEAGAGVAKKCTSCHSFEQGGPTKIGPNLWNIVERPIGSSDGFSYSDALSGKSGEVWSYENLNEFLAKPKDWAPGTKMAFPGLKKVEDRANVIAYLRSFSDSPAPLPE